MVLAERKVINRKIVCYSQQIFIHRLIW